MLAASPVEGNCTLVSWSPTRHSWGHGGSLLEEVLALNQAERLIANAIPHWIGPRSNMRRGHRDL